MFKKLKCINIVGLFVLSAIKIKYNNYKFLITNNQGDINLKIVRIIVGTLHW